MEAVEACLEDVAAACNANETAFVLQDGEIPFGIRRQGEMVAFRKQPCEMIGQTTAEIVRFIETDAHCVQ